MHSADFDVCPIWWYLLPTSNPLESIDSRTTTCVARVSALLPSTAYCGDLMQQKDSDSYANIASKKWGLQFYFSPFFCPCVTLDNSLLIIFFAPTLRCKVAYLGFLHNGVQTKMTMKYNYTHRQNGWSRALLWTVNNDDGKGWHAGDVNGTAKVLCVEF
jgi:hypothetical protein